MKSVHVIVFTFVFLTYFPFVPLDWQFFRHVILVKSRQNLITPLKRYAIEINSFS